MLNERFKITLLQNLKNEELKTYNVDGLISFMENSDINYYMADLNGPLGMATFDGVYIDVNNIIRNTPCKSDFLYFVILHETSHMKRMKKIGKEEILKNLSLTEFNEFFEHVVNEELISDKYALINYYKLNKFSFPIFYTQQLNLTENKEIYKMTARGFFGKIQNDETKYNDFVKKFIKKIYND
jgi:hypothetical protein